MAMAIQIALVPYFFCVCLTDSIPLIFVVVALVFKYLHDLTIHCNPAANYTKYGEDRYKNSSNSQPLVQIQADKKTEYDATRHGQADLHYNGEVFSPHTVLFIIKNHL